MFLKIKQQTLDWNISVKSDKKIPKTITCTKEEQQWWWTVWEENSYMDDDDGIYKGMRLMIEYVNG